MLKKVFFLILTFLVMACAHENVKPVDANGIFINEIAAKGGQDWIEIYNDLDVQQDLTGYVVYDDTKVRYTLPSLTIASKGFLVLLCDGTGTGTNTNFRLSSAGESVYLEDPQGRLVDKVEFPAMSGSQSYSRFPDGGTELLLTGEPTQGSSNGNGQYATLRNAVRDPLIPGLSSAVKITVEAFDPKGLVSVKLFYRFNNNPFQFTSMSLSSGLYTATIPAAGNSGQMDYYIEAINSINLISVQPSTAPTEPYFYILTTDPIPNLVINEYLASNISCCSDPDGLAGEFDDWIEIFNKGNTAVDLGGMYLSDSIANPFKFRIPLGQAAKTTVAPGGYLVIYADEQGTQGPLHANFKLNQLGEQVGLFFKDGRTIDTRIFGIQESDKSEGRKPNGSSTWSKMSPTRGSSNQ